MKKFISPLVFFGFLILPAVAWADDKLDQAVRGTLLESRDNLYVYVGSIIKYVLGALGIVLVVLIIYAGFLWMTARGDEEKITKAKNILITSIIGLIIVMAAYIITYFVIDVVQQSR